MTDRELDALVAEKVFGYALDWEMTDECDHIALDGKCGECLTILAIHPYDILPYSTEVTFAMDAASEVMKRNPWGNGFRLETHCENSEEKWLCFFPTITSAPPYEEMNPEANEAEADTAAKAICLAALKAVGVEVPA